MTNQDYTHIVIVLDRSGSMSFIKDETEQALNNFVEEQKQLPGKATLSYFTFSEKVKTEFVRRDLSEVGKLTLNPSGMTALHDAMAKAIESEGEVLAALPEDDRPGKVVVVTITDGAENSSMEYTADSVRKLVKQQKETYGWDFVFLGANQDAVLTASQFGINQGSALTYAATAGGIQNTSNIVSSYVTATRSGLQAHFTDEDRKTALDSNSSF